LVNLFKKAKHKEKIKNLPEHYSVVRRGKEVNIRSLNISKVYIGDDVFVSDLFGCFDLELGSVESFSDPIDFQMFVYDNFYKLTQIYVSNITVSYDYILRNGVLHSESGTSIIKYDKKGCVIENHQNYYLNGVNVYEEKFKMLIREKKLKRILSFID